MSGLERVIRLIRECHWEALPSAVQRQIKMALLDDLGSTPSGTLTRISRMATDYAVETWPADEATILLHDRRASGRPSPTDMPPMASTSTIADSIPRGIPVLRSFPRRWLWPRN